MWPNVTRFFHFMGTMPNAPHCSRHTIHIKLENKRSMTLVQKCTTTLTIRSHWFSKLIARRKKDPADWVTSTYPKQLEVLYLTTGKLLDHSDNNWNQPKDNIEHRKKNQLTRDEQCWACQSDHFCNSSSSFRLLSLLQKIQSCTIWQKKMKNHLIKSSFRN